MWDGVVYLPGLALNVKNFDEVLALSKHSHHIADMSRAVRRFVCIISGHGFMTFRIA